MAEVSRHIRQRLAEVFNDLRNAVGREAAKVYLTRISNVELVESESGADSCMDFVNEDCMTDARNSFSPSRKVEEPLLQITHSMTKTNSSCSESLS